jgi:tRNA pseudouridine55 synthase
VTEARPSGDGLVVVDKPTGWTSHDVVAKLRKLAGTRRVGHAGTLDPMATGVLVVGIGGATRLLGHLALQDKCYDATIRLGVTTTTDDADGEVVATTDGVDDVGPEQLTAAMRQLTGDIDQVPSSVSAIKVAGERAYAKVRRGEDVELAARPVRVQSFELVARRGSDLDVRVQCSTGTYVRALARDLGAALCVGAHLVALRRTSVGRFGLDQARTLEQLAERWQLMPLAEAVDGTFRRWDVDAATAARLAFGQRLAPVGLGPGLSGAFAPDGQVVALVEERDDAVRPVLVFPPAAQP